jgi:hypothetical protein
VNGEVAGSEGELDTTAFSPGDVVELRARLETEDGVTRPVTGKPVALARGEVPEILSEPHAGVENGLFRYQLRARSNAEGAKLSYELLKGPDGMTVDAKSGVVLWRPTTEQRGRFDVEVAVKDQWGSGVAQFFALQADAPGQPPAASR